MLMFFVGLSIGLLSTLAVSYLYNKSEMRIKFLENQLERQREINGHNEDINTELRKTISEYQKLDLTQF